MIRTSGGRLSGNQTIRPSDTDNLMPRSPSSWSPVIHISIIFIQLIFILSLQINAATWLDPSLKWKTLETPHFSINYYTELEDVAKRFAPIAEDVYETMTKVFKYKIGLKTQVTLLDTTDFGNGFTMVFPYPSITLYLTDLSSSFNTYKYD